MERKRRSWNYNGNTASNNVANNTSSSSITSSTFAIEVDEVPPVRNCKTTGRRLCWWKRRVPPRDGGIRWRNYNRGGGENGPRHVVSRGDWFAEDGRWNVHRPTRWQGARNIDKGLVSLSWLRTILYTMSIDFNGRYCQKGLSVAEGWYIF